MGICKNIYSTNPKWKNWGNSQLFSIKYEYTAKKEWYITFYNENKVIIVFRSKIFKLSPSGISPIHGKLIDISSAEQKNEWNEMINYAKSLGIPDSQCDFLPEKFLSNN